MGEAALEHCRLFTLNEFRSFTVTEAVLLRVSGERTQNHSWVFGAYREWISDEARRHSFYEQTLVSDVLVISWISFSYRFVRSPADGGHCSLEQVEN